MTVNRSRQVCQYHGFCARISPPCDYYRPSFETIKNYITIFSEQINIYHHVIFYISVNFLLLLVDSRSLILPGLSPLTDSEVTVTKTREGGREKR
jgi:hypothetical protein